MYSGNGYFMYFFWCNFKLTHQKQHTVCISDPHPTAQHSTVNPPYSAICSPHFVELYSGGGNSKS